MGFSWKAADFLGGGRATARDDDPDALFALGISYQTGTEGVAVNLVEAHKWFNLAAVAGQASAADARADVADAMTPREIAEAQRRARAWMSRQRAEAPRLRAA